MRQYCCDNVTMFAGNKVVCYCNITLFSVSRHGDLNICHIFSGPWGSITLLRCRCREAIKLSRAPLLRFSLTFLPFCPHCSVLIATSQKWKGPYNTMYCGMALAQIRANLRKFGLCPFIVEQLESINPHKIVSKNWLLASGGDIETRKEREVWPPAIWGKGYLYSR